jgi:ComF family protein
LKYDGMTPLAATLGGYLSRALPIDEAYDAVVPVPLHWFRRFQRGFNQAALLAGQIGKTRNLPLLRAVRRTQTGLTNAKRRQNVAGAFRARRIDGLRILLVDDVMTTGATGSACASALKRAGAKSVTLLTVARVDRRSGLPAPVAKNRTAGAS